MIKFLYRIYQLCIAIPVTVLMTIWTAIVVGLGTTLGDGHYWGYYPGRWWAKVITRVFRFASQYAIIKYSNQPLNPLIVKSLNL